ncbi:MAG: GtrA family protein [Bacteroidota bacterium]|nr:GtrA family protein [Bacteroidota bacterium]MDP4247903.1 GtrA family protein [Bacteroidota bacterium]MDP4256509.1 GtrA family protein [Bacteroidota bacterium]MDP4260160.1 GtrA family protein [Bacteroidota bacterium]
MVKKRIIAFIDYFYPPFSRFMPLQTFRYAACGGGNTILDICLFSISYNFILHKQDLDLGFYVLRPHIAAFLMAFFVSFPVGFLLNRNIVFSESTLHGRVQLFRYFLLIVACVLLNYIFLKLFVEQWHIYPTIAKIFTTFIVVTFSYLTQKNYTFKAGQQGTPPDGI